MLEGHAEASKDTFEQMHPKDPHAGKPYYQFLVENFHLYAKLLGVRAMKSGNRLRLTHAKSYAQSNRDAIVIQLMKDFNFTLEFDNEIIDEPVPRLQAS